MLTVLKSVKLIQAVAHISRLSTLTDLQMGSELDQYRGDNGGVKEKRGESLTSGSVNKSEPDFKDFETFHS